MFFGGSGIDFSVGEWRSAAGAESSRKIYGLASTRVDFIAFRPPLRFL